MQEEFAGVWSHSPIELEGGCSIFHFNSVALQPLFKKKKILLPSFAVSYVFHSCYSFPSAQIKAETKADVR